MQVPELVWYKGRVRNAAAFRTTGTGHLGQKYGLGLYETMRWSGRHLPLGEYHCQRLAEGMHRLGGYPPLDARQKALDVLKNVESVLETESVEPARIRVDVWWQGSPAPYSLDTEPTLAYAFRWQPVSAELPTSFLRLGQVPGLYPTAGDLRGLKLTAAPQYLLAARRAQAAGWDDALLQTESGFLAETSRYNLLLFRDGHWYTPTLEGGGVAGVARAWLLAHKWVSEDAMPPQSLGSAEGLAVCNALYGVRPVTEVTWQDTQYRFAPHPARALAHEFGLKVAK